MSEKKPRKPRADALRNREHILNVARDAFAEGGAKVTLDDIVKLSGIGVGTLYRHFPTRDALLEALYWSEVEKLSAAEKELSAAHPPAEALRRWLLLFVDMMAQKMALKEALSAMVCGTDELYNSSTEMVTKTVTGLAERAAAAGEIRLNLDPLDLLRALAGLANTSPDPNWQESARKMVDVLVSGMRV